MTVAQRKTTFTAVRDRQPTPERLRALVVRHGEEIKNDPEKAREFFIRVGVLTGHGRLAKPYCSAE